MRTGLIPITFAVAFPLLACACGGTSDQEVHEAQTSGYKGDFAVIYSETLAAVRDLYPHLNEDARTGVIRTAWHPVHVQQGADDDSTQSATVNPRSSRTGFQSAVAMREQFFVRFAIHVVGGRPWRVRVHGEASAWKTGEMPTPLRGSEIPHWLAGRVNGLEVAIYRRLKGYAVELKYAPAAAPTARAAAVDMAKFGQVPPAAARVIAAVEQAAGARDLAALRKLMADQFTYTTGDEPSADTAILIWQADPTILGELDRVLDAGCAHDQTRREVVCPAAFLQDPGQSGYRAGFREVDGGWRMVSFTAGE